MDLRHLPVMVEEVINLLRCEPGKVFVDATLGEGGHASAILKRTAPDGFVIGIEWDEEALSIAKEVLRPFGDRVQIFQENFIYLSKFIEMESVDGILLDLGVSSLQLEDEKRGFSFQKEGPLDMRMDLRIDQTAADLINSLSKKELELTLLRYGEERWAKRIAESVVRVREREPIQTTQALRKIVHEAIPRRFHPRRIDPATRTFQALRIRVNDELGNLKKVLEIGWRFLKKGGRICILSFHSLEDRMVKEAFRKLEREGKMRILTPKPISPSKEEVMNNPRSRSAKMRCAERI